MGDIVELRDLVTQQIRAARDAQIRQDNLLDELVRARNAPVAPVADPRVEAAAIEAAEAAAEAARIVARTEKFNKLAYAMRKSYKVKEYKDAGGEIIKEWLRKFDQEIATLKRYSGIADDLTRDEIVELFKDKLSHQTISRLNTAFVAKEPQWTWAAVTYDELKAIMKEEYGKKTTEVSEVLLQFGSERMKKPPEMSVAKFAHQWQEQIPECLLPTTDEECRKLADLIKRSLFYHCLDDKYIQNRLCEVEEGDTSFKRCFDQACVIEQRRKAFQEIGTSGAKLDSTNGVIISKIDSEKQNNGQGKSGNSDKLNDSRSRGNSDQIGSKGRGRGAYERSWQQRS